MKRIVCLIALMALSSPASARDPYLSLHGHRIHISALRHCRSLSCVRLAIAGLAWRRGRDRDADVDTTPDAVATPAPAASPPAPAQAQPSSAPAPVQAQPTPAPAQPRPPSPVMAQVASTVTRTPVAVAQPAPVAAPTLAAVAGAQIVRPTGKQETTASTPTAPPPAVGFEMGKPQPGAVAAKSQPLTADKVNATPLDKTPDKPLVPLPPAAARSAPKAAPQVARASEDDDDPADTPLGDWQTEGRNGLVRIEACGVALCGYVLNASTREKGEIILVNMKPKSDVWSGNIYSRSSGNSYYGTVTMKEPNTLRVEACALGRFFCSGNNWTRIEQGRSVRQHDLATSRSPSNRS